MLLNRLVLLCKVLCEIARLRDPNTADRTVVASFPMVHKLSNLRERLFGSSLE